MTMPTVVERVTPQNPFAGLRITRVEYVRCFDGSVERHAFPQTFPGRWVTVAR